MSSVSSDLPSGSLAADPWAYHPHLLGWALAMLIGLAWVVLSRVVGDARPTAKQIGALAGGLACLAVALTWPLADLAAHWSLSALLVQRMLLTLGAAPLLVLSIPPAMLSWLTKPAPVDWVAYQLSRVAPAMVVFGVVVIGTLVPSAVAEAASSSLVRDGFDLLMLLAGLALWAPVLPVVPGADRPGPMGRAVYLFVQSLVPTFPAVIYVFARHPIYPAFLDSHRAIGISPLNDQQLAGILAKVATLPVLWGTAAVIIARGQRADERELRTGEDQTSLTWADVARRLQRAERRERRAQRRKQGAGTGTGRVAPPRIKP